LGRIYEKGNGMSRKMDHKKWKKLAVLQITIIKSYHASNSKDENHPGTFSMV
jgi:hypothetical protein